MKRPWDIESRVYLEDSKFLLFKNDYHDIKSMEETVTHAKVHGVELGCALR